MFRNIVSPRWCQEWTPSCLFPTHHTHTLQTARLCLRSALVGCGFVFGSNYCEKSWEGAEGGLAGGPPPRSGAAFKLRFSSLVLTWAMLQVSWYLIFYLAYLGLDPHPNVWITGLISGSVSSLGSCLGTTDCWLALSAIPGPALCFSHGCCGTLPLVTGLTVTPPVSTPPLQDSPCLLLPGTVISCFLYLIHV